MANTLNFIVEDIDTQISTYDVIRIYRATSLTGAYAALSNVSLVANTVYYSYNDSSGTLNHWYRYTYYNTVTLAETSQSAPFRMDGTTRLRIRQRMLATYKLGIVILAAAGGAAGTVVTNDYRVKNSSFGTNRGKGGWTRPTTGNRAGEICGITASTPSTGTITISPSMTGALAAGDEVEWHWFADPALFDEAINRAAKRYWYVDRLPLVGVNDQDEYSLSSMPWLKTRSQITDIRYYPSRSSGADDGLEESWGTGGNWWDIREDNGSFYLMIRPTITTSDMLYLYSLRQMPELFEDAAQPPIVAEEELWAALAYDELLARLTQPGASPETSRISLKQARVEHHKITLMPLFKRYPVKAPVAPHRQPWPSAVPTPWTAR